MVLMFKSRRNLILNWKFGCLNVKYGLGLNCCRTGGFGADFIYSGVC